MNRANNNKAVWLGELGDVAGYAKAKARGWAGGSEPRSRYDQTAQVYIDQIRDLSLWDLPNVRERQTILDSVPPDEIETVQGLVGQLGESTEWTNDQQGIQGRAATDLLTYFPDGFANIIEGQKPEWVISLEKWDELFEDRLIIHYISYSFQREQDNYQGGMTYNTHGISETTNLPLPKSWSDSPKRGAAAPPSGGRAPARKRRRTLNPEKDGNFGRALDLGPGHKYLGEMKLRF